MRVIADDWIPDVDDGRRAVFDQLLSLPRRVLHSRRRRRFGRSVQRCIWSVVGTDPMATRTGDHAAAVPSERSFDFDRNELVVQLARASRATIGIVRRADCNP